MRSVAVALAGQILLCGCYSTSPDELGGGEVVRDGVVYSARISSRATKIDVRLNVRNLTGHNKQIVFPGSCRVALILHPTGTVGADPLWDGREGVGCFHVASRVPLGPSDEEWFAQSLDLHAVDGAGRILGPGQYRATIWVYADGGFEIDAGSVHIRSSD